MRSDRWQQHAAALSIQLASYGIQWSKLVRPIGPSSSNFGRSARPCNLAVEALADDDGWLQLP